MSIEDVQVIKTQLAKERQKILTGHENGNLIPLEIRLAEIYLENQETHNAAETYRLIGWQYYVAKDYEQALTYFTKAADTSVGTFSRQEKLWLYYRMHECQDLIKS